MCGIVAIVRRQSTRAVPSAAQVLTLVNAAAAAFDADSVTSLDGCRASLQELNSLLLGVPGAVALLESPGLSAEIAAQLDPLMKTLTTTADDAVASGEIIAEDLNAARRAIKDVLWAVLRDRLKRPRGHPCVGWSWRIRRRDRRPLFGARRPVCA